LNTNLTSQDALKAKYSGENSNLVAPSYVDQTNNLRKTQFSMEKEEVIVKNKESQRPANLASNSNMTKKNNQFASLRQSHQVDPLH